MTQLVAGASRILRPTQTILQSRRGVMKWGARGPVPRAPCLSDASTGNEVNSTHSPLDSIMDLSRFLNGGVKHEGAFDDLAQSIGKEIYIDIQGWHLYLRDLHVETDITMDQALASQLGVIAPPSREATECVLKGIPLDMGEGKLRIPLFDAIPMKGIQDLTKILAAYNKC